MTPIHRIILLTLTAGIALCPAQVKRGRNEGTFNIPASNVVGNGNILAGAAFAGSINGSGVRLDPGGFLAVGITDIMQLSGRMALTNFKSIGGTEAHFQLTMPGNEHLRFFGAAISGDLYLSTEMDTLSGAATSGRPEYHAYVRPSLIADLDWIARFKQLPLKTYLMLGMADNPDLLFLYSQLSVRMGLELKLNRNSYSVDFGAGFYRERARAQTDFAGDATFRQQRLWVEPAVRYRLFDRFSILGAVRILLLQRVKNERPLEPSYVRLSLALEAPILYKETTTEAIRTMVFVEREKVRQTSVLDSSAGIAPETKSNLDLEVKKLDLDVEEGESEEDVLKRREEIQKKMDEIEKLLEDVQ
jgi:hypothetical protein